MGSNVNIFGAIDQALALTGGVPSTRHFGQGPNGLLGLVSPTLVSPLSPVFSNEVPTLAGDQFLAPFLTSIDTIRGPLGTLDGFGLPGTAGTNSMLHFGQGPNSLLSLVSDMLVSPLSPVFSNQIPQLPTNDPSLSPFISTIDTVRGVIPGGLQPRQATLGEMVVGMLTGQPVNPGVQQTGLGGNTILEQLLTLLLGQGQGQPIVPLNNPVTPEVQQPGPIGQGEAPATPVVQAEAPADPQPQAEAPAAPQEQPVTPPPPAPEPQAEAPTPDPAPDLTPPTAPPTPPASHTVVAGDTLSAIIASRKGSVSKADIDRVAAASGISNPDLIMPGQEIDLSGI